MGARLQSFWKTWEKYQVDQWVLEVLRDGYQVPFKNNRLPPMTLAPQEYQSYQNSPEKFAILQQEVKEMVQKGAVEIVQPREKAFYNRLFLVPKPDGKWRPVLDVSRLNKYVKKTKFTMETPQTVQQALRKGDWLISLDMKDAYFHIPVHPQSRKFLRFMFDGVIYQFKALCFGLSTAPQVFTRVLAPVGKIVHLAGFRMILYLDDWLIIASSIEEMLRAKDFVLNLTKELGVMINFEKSHLVPTQQLIYLGMSIDTTRFWVFPSPETSGQRIRNLQRVHVLKTASSAIMAQLTRAYVLPGEVHTRGKAQNETVSVLSQESLEQGETRFESSDSNTGGLGPKVRVVEFGGKAGQKGFVAEQEPRPNVVLRCVQGKVGRNIGKSSPVGQLESGGSKGTHKQAGVTGNMVCAERDGRISNRQSSGHILRQHDSPELHSEAGRDKILVPVRFGEADAVVGGGEGNSTNTQVYRRKEKCCGRCPQQERANNPHRVVFERPSVQQAVEVMGTSTSGPVCLKPKQKAANVFCPTPGPSSFGGGRNATDLGQPRRLCLPSVCHAEEGHKQIRKIEELSDDVSGSMVASKGMVPGSDEAIDRRTKEAASQAGSSSSTRRQGSSSKRPKSSLDRMETVLRLAGAKKISKEVSKRINAARRHSTNELYQARWATFVSWCRKNGISASKPSINEVCKFLIYLWEKKKLSVGTIKGYRSTLNSVLRHSGMAISMDQDVSDVIRSFMVERPMQDKEKVMWNVDVVLKYLCSKRFEPLESASLRDLTKKTLFLVSLALAKRVSEVHALTRPVGFTSQGALVSLALKFRAKNDTKCKELPRNFLIKELTSLVGKEEEHKLCPVRAIKAYLDRTNPLGGMEATSLFLAPSNPSRGASKNALSYMLRSLIREAHVNLNPELLPMFKANVHEVRAVGTSLAFAHNMSLDTVIEAAQWRCNSVFASHYLKEIAIQYENCCTLGPLVTAGIVIP